MPVSQLVDWRCRHLFLRRLLPALVAAITSLTIVLSGFAQTQPLITPPVYLETFTLDTPVPTPYRPPGFDVSVIGSQNDTIESMWAEHGPDCSAPEDQWPGGAPNPAFNHYISTVRETVFSCRDHIMTAINGGYGATYLTVPALMDWSQGPARFEWDMSTQRTSSRDWMDVVIQPFEPGFEGPMALNFQDFHTPHDVIQLELQGGGNVWAPQVMLDAPAPGCGNGSYWKGQRYYCRFQFDGYNSWDRMLAAKGLTTSAARRDHFMIEVTSTHLKMGFRASPNDPYRYWVDTDIPGGPLRWSAGVTQLNQRAYNPLKGCGAIGVGEPGHPPDGWVDDGTHKCRAGTWHIDNMQIAPYLPFTIIPGVRRIVMPGGTVTFPVPAPANSFIKAAGAWSDTQYSIDGGKIWGTMPIVGPKAPPEIGDSYWLSIPEGTQTIMFRGTDPRWAMQDIYIYSRATLPPAPTPTPEPPATPQPSPTPGPPPADTATPTPVTPVPTVEPSATPIPTPVPTQEVTPTAGPTSPSVTPTPEPPTDQGCTIVAYQNGEPVWRALAEDAACS